MRLDMVTLVVPDYDEAISFFVDRLGFVLAEDSAAAASDGRPKRWVVVAPPDGGTAILLARADGADQEAAVGHQTGGRVGFFLRVDDFGAHHRRLIERGVRFLEEPRLEPYGRVAVFTDHVGNRWDLLGPE